MAVLDRIRLIDQLRRSPAFAGLLYVWAGWSRHSRSGPPACADGSSQIANIGTTRHEPLRSSAALGGACSRRSARLPLPADSSAARGGPSSERAQLACWYRAIVLPSVSLQIE